jgi:prepilin-type N-terminal cleavage/methylation domain-containing protein
MSEISMRLTQTNVNQAVKRAKATGFTLTELLVASAITSVVLVLAGSGLVTLLTADQAAEQRQNRQQELNRALAFIADDIRAAQRVNLNEANNTVTADAALADAVRRFPAEVPYKNSIRGSVALYLEIPVGVCSGNPVLDRVTYEVRTKRTDFLTSSTPLGDKLWYGPYLLYRHGRIPRLDGGINPCSEPVKSEVLVDGLLNENASNPPLCGPSGPVLSGIGGFYTCVTGGQVALMFRGDASPRPWERGNNNPTIADVTPTTLTSMVFQRGTGPEASPSPGASPTSVHMCNVPNLLGRELTSAKSSASSSGLKYNAVADPMLNTHSKEVASQVPAPGSKLPCGHIVMFTYKP